MRARLRPALLLALATALIVVAVGATTGLLSSPPARDLDPVDRACRLEDKLLLRIWRGLDEQRSEDVIMVPKAPNYSGGFLTVNHSGPWDYLQRVPLVLYGPGSIAAQGRALEKHASITDVYSTVGELLGVELPARRGSVLDDAIAPDPQSPRLVIVLVWDGVGRNVLERWPQRWPTLARLEREGTSYVDATVGSSPTITPATHASLGTGDFPRAHGVTGIYYRGSRGGIKQAFQGRNPSLLRRTTFADEIDRRLGNRPIVGAVAWRNWHMGMLGHGARTPGGDEDILALIGGSEGARARGYAAPSYLASAGDFERHARATDRTDGRVDGKWRGHPIEDKHENPAWVAYETGILLEMLARAGFGADGVPDLLLANYKVSDITAHQYFMTSPEMGDVLEAQDEALAQILDYLDQNVEDYVVVVTADHGHVPPPTETGAWPVLNGSLAEDVDDRFGVEDEPSLVEQTVGAGLFLNRSAMHRQDLTPEKVAEFLNGYTIRDNWDEAELPDGYEERGDELVFSAVFAKRQMRSVMDCALEDRRGSLVPRTHSKEPGR